MRRVAATAIAFFIMGGLMIGAAVTDALQRGPTFSFYWNGAVAAFVITVVTLQLFGIAKEFMRRRE